MMLQINYILPRSRANGPGVRFTVWVQGCSIHCFGCNNKAMWDPQAGRDISVDDLIQQIKITEDINGITITGGEPLDQFESIFDLCSKLFNKIPIFLTTGYTFKDLRFKKYLKITSVLDIICVGPFKLAEKGKFVWKGSGNQEVLALTEKGWHQIGMPVVYSEVHIKNNGEILKTGFTI